jgi:PST family polysaccharide transporter
MVVLTIYLLAKYIIYMINGNYDANMILNLQIMSIVVLIGGVNYYYGVLGLITMGYKKEFSKAIIITGISNIILSLILVYFFKDIGASFSLVLSEIVLLAILLNYYKRI